MKTCTKCGSTKPDTDFYTYGKKGKRHGSCKTCYKKRSKEDKVKQGRRHRKSVELRWQYGLSIEDYERMIELCDNKCEICGAPPPTKGRKKTLCVDHCHDTGIVRGLLCDKCNRAIGLIGEDHQTLLKAIQYLARSRPLQ